MARRSPVARVSVLAALPFNGDGIHRKCRLLDPSAFPAQLPIVPSDSPGLRLARPGNDCGLLVAARNRPRHRIRTTKSVSLDGSGAPDFRRGEHPAGPHDLRLAGTLAGPTADARNHGRTVFLVYPQPAVDRPPDLSLRA